MPELVPGLVSVIVPIYNVEPFLRDCLDSLRAQTYTDLQVLMVDDGSTDGCAAIAEEFAAADSRFALIRQANAGLSAARNVAVPQAKGEYLAFVDSDDVLAAHAYELLVQALAGGADFASGAVRRYSSRGTYRGGPHNDAIGPTDLDTHHIGRKIIRFVAAARLRHGHAMMRGQHPVFRDQRASTGDRSSDYSHHEVVFTRQAQLRG